MISSSKEEEEKKSTAIRLKSALRRDTTRPEVSNHNEKRKNPLVKRIEKKKGEKTGDPHLKKLAE